MSEGESKVSESVLKLLSNGKVRFPITKSEQKLFIRDSVGEIWNSLLSININSNLQMMIHVDDEESRTSTYDACEGSSHTAWHGLEKTLLMLLVLEDALEMDINFSGPYLMEGEIDEEKKSVRSKLKI